MAGGHADVLKGIKYEKEIEEPYDESGNLDLEIK